ncbi:carboxypeptidase-like regulatory domain-containing protein [Bremerella sp. JC770]|uniref:carboxypeptidase-like regulatory domain-containing protein n=1 Tax=Bremerella sp. JC770 TaxID=3232137 RepID=UPI00345AD547
MMRLGYVAVLVCAPLWIGCGDGNKLKPVSGVVTMDGDPLEAATVVFVPIEGGRGNAVATTDQQGRYELSYINDKGTEPGTYKVIVTKPRQTKRGEVETLPSQYNSASDVTAEIKANGENRFDFNLESGS